MATARRLLGLSRCKGRFPIPLLALLSDKSREICRERGRENVGLLSIPYPYMRVVIFVG